jgi:hypothetical protein
MIMDAEESAMSEHVVCAVADANICSVGTPFSSVILAMPPKRKHMPMTSNRLDKMDPSMDDCTTWIWPSLRATMLTISSTALPKVALSRPPSVSPSFTDISSVANERTAARGMMAKKLRVKTAVGFQPISPAQMPKGTTMRRTLT